MSYFKGFVFALFASLAVLFISGTPALAQHRGRGGGGGGGHYPSGPPHGPAPFRAQPAPARAAPMREAPRR
ncbi:MAG TPA: hypothetical protein VIK30_13170, partial [Polyangia bacterium]